MTKLACLAIAATLVAASAQAEEHKVVVAYRTLTYSDAQLATPHGAAKLLGRIEGMAAQLCASSSPSVPHIDDQARACRAGAIAHAVETLAAPSVSAAHADRKAALTVASR